MTKYFQKCHAHAKVCVIKEVVNTRSVIQRDSYTAKPVIGTS